MKKLFALFLLISHTNSTLFLSIVEEYDKFYSNRIEVDNINSVFEYINEVLLQNVDDTPDEDDSQPHFYQMVKAGNYYFHQVSIEVKKPVSTNQHKKSFPEFKQAVIHNVSYDIISPPPEA